MKRLSMADALFLYTETPETPMHVASVTIFKPATQQGDLFAHFREHVEAQLISCLRLADASSRRRSASTIRLG